MKLPGFNAAASLGSISGMHLGSAVSKGADGLQVLPALGKTCTNCAIVGGFGTIKGIGQRSCCQPVYNPITHTTETSCWFESCTPEQSIGGLLSFSRSDNVREIALRAGMAAAR